MAHKLAHFKSDFRKSQPNTAFKFESQPYIQLSLLPQTPTVNCRTAGRERNSVCGRRNRRGMASTQAPPTPTRVSNAVAGVAAAAELKTMLITGVSRGLGRALALELAKLGHTVIGCSRSADKLSSLQSELAAASENKSNSGKHLILNVDVSSDSSVEELARAVVEKKVIPNIIVNNAGTINKNNKLWEISAEQFDSVIDTNLKGTANVLRHFIPLMIQKKHGIIVNMSSGWGRSVAAQVAPYCASKWAVEGLTRAVAKELPPGVAVVALNPGVINTVMLESCFGSTAALYPTPESWAPKAATLILHLTVADNGASLTV
ncbi:hypothetical protein ABFS83_02G078100 [Erythranthe nasuta]